MSRLLIIILITIFCFSATAEASTNNNFSCSSRLGEFNISGQFDIKNEKFSMENFFLTKNSQESRSHITPIYIKDFAYSKNSIKLYGVFLNSRRISHVYLNISGQLTNNLAKGVMEVGERKFVIYDSCKFTSN